MTFALADLTIMQAPMAGGPATPELVREVGAAGGLGFLAAGYKSAQAMREEIARTRTESTARFGVNLFVPQPGPGPGPDLTAYIAELRPEADRYGVALPEPRFDDDDWDAKVTMLVDDPVPVVSFTFGLPSRAVVEELRRAGSVLLATVTTAAEARAATDLGFDALCVQGPEAGAHRGTHDPSARPGAVPLLELLTEVRSVTELPLVAAGGIGTADDVATALAAGAAAVQLGTAYLRTPESGAKAAHKAALVDPAFGTAVVTRAFSGRSARALRNRFTDEHDEGAPAAYPHVHQLTAPIRAAAAARSDPHGMALWAGAAHRHSSEEPAAELTERLGSGAARS